MKNIFKTISATLLLTSFFITHSQASSNTPSKEEGLNTPPKHFALFFNNASHGTLRDDEIFIEIISTPTAAVSYVALEKPTPRNLKKETTGSIGNVVTAQPNELITSFTLADLKNHTLYLPENGKYYGTRIYFSIKKPLQMTVNSTANGYIQPDLENAEDPNYAIPFDWFEMTYDPTPQSSQPSLNTVAFGGNMSEVDLFSIPLAFTIKGVNGTTLTRGITLGANSSSGVNTRDELINKYLTASNIASPFKQLTQKTEEGKIVRLIAPYHSSLFKLNGKYEGYFDKYINNVWSYYKTNQLDAYDQPNQKGNHYTGGVTANGLLTFYCNGVGPFTIAKPSSYEIFTSNGVFQSGGAETNAFGAILAAAFNRHVAASTSSWLSPINYYQAAPANDWANFWHEVSIDHLAYGFGFDDVGNQSSVAILPANESLSSLTLTIGW